MVTTVNSHEICKCLELSAETLKHGAKGCSFPQIQVDICVDIEKCFVFAFHVVCFSKALVLTQEFVVVAL